MHESEKKTYSSKRKKAENHKIEFKNEKEFFEK